MYKLDGLDTFNPPMVSLFDVVVGLVWSNDPESHAGGSIATGRATHAGQSKGMIQTKRDTLILQVGGWARD
jgi:hypothetical protein